MTMKGAEYLNESGLKYFNSISKILDKRGMNKDEFSHILSMLCSELAKYEEAQKLGQDEGWYNKYPNGTVQVNAYTTMSEKAFNSVKSLMIKFGLTPKDLEEIEGKDKKDNKPKSDPLKEFN